VHNNEERVEIEESWTDLAIYQLVHVSNNHWSLYIQQRERRCRVSILISNALRFLSMRDRCARTHSIDLTMPLLQILGSQRTCLHSRMLQIYLSARSCTKGCEVDVPMRTSTDQNIYIHLPSESS
jgi:hypothetical protein